MSDSQRRRYFFFLVNYFMQGIVGFTYEPMEYLLKDRLKLSAGQAAGFVAWMTFPFLLKPLYGFIADTIPIGGYRRKPHIILTALLASLAYFSLAAQAAYTYVGLLIPLALACFWLAFADVVCCGLLVEDGKERKQTGRYQAIYVGMLYLTSGICGLGGGWMTTHLTYRMVFTLAGCVPLVIAASGLFIHESTIRPAAARVGFPLWKFVRTKDFRTLGLTIMLWNFYPFLGTVQFYYQSNVLKLNPLSIGFMTTVGSITGLLGSMAYWKFGADKDNHALLSRGPVVMALVSSMYLLYFGPVSVALVEIVYGFTNVFFRVALLDLVARSCPAEAEATTFALFIGLFDIAMLGSNTIGGKLYDFLQHYFSSVPYHDRLSAAFLVLIGAGCTLACRWTLPSRGSASILAGEEETA